MGDSTTGEPTNSGINESTDASAPHLARCASTIWQQEDLRAWDMLHLVTPWLLLGISGAAFFFWEFPASAQSFWPEGAAVLGLVVVSALWVFFGHTLPIKSRTLRPVPAAIAFVGLLALCVILMTYSDIFIIFTIACFFHAYWLTPWPLGLLGVLTTSVALNSVAMRVWERLTPQLLAEFILIVVVQTAAIGAGILLALRSETAERKREQLVQRLEATLHENAGLHAQLVTQARESGVQDERQRLANEIHDTLAQGLAGIITQLQAAQRSTAMQETSQSQVTRALELARSSLTQARRSVRALTPQELGKAQLPEALHTLTKTWSDDHGMRAQFEVTGDQEPLSPAIEVSLFRVAQEALTNVDKHAKASRVGVTLSYTGREVLLDVRDDGRGFLPAADTGFGLTSMRQRIRGVGGQIEVHSTPGHGTSVSARVPAIAPGGTAQSRGVLQ